MKLTKKTVHEFLRFFLLGITAGALLWELISRLLQAVTGLSIDLSTAPVGFDIHVISLYIKLNIGCIPGGIMGWVLFSKL